MDSRNSQEFSKKIYNDSIFVGLLLIPMSIWGFIYFLSGTIEALGPIQLLNFVLLYPVVEEVIFRGMIQPYMAKKYSHNLANISSANLLTSTLFAIIHLFQHPVIWALATFFPSLIFGYCRDRYRRLLPSIILHITYNGGYFLVGFGAFKNPIPF